MTTLTQSEWNALTYIQQYQRKWGAPPKQVDVQRGCGIGTKRETSNVLSALESAGLVRQVRRKQQGSSAVLWHVQLVGSGTVGVEL